MNAEQFIESIDQLPQLPQAVIRLTQRMEDPDVSADDLAEIIRIDPNLTAQMLRLCNSAAYGLSRKIDTVKDAVAILGFNTLKSMAYTIISHLSLKRDLPGYFLKSGDLWLHGVTGAFYARHIAQKHLPKPQKLDPELAFTAALLRDIGKIVLANQVGTNYAVIDRYAAHHQVGFDEAEKEIIGVSHTEVGMAIARKWQLPERMVLVIGYHHNPENIPAETPDSDKRLLACVHLADGLATLLGNGIGGDGMMYQLHYPSIIEAGLALDKGLLEVLMSELIDLQSQIETLTASIHLPPKP
ncbi:MAG: HDOD domain-containing protein [Vampirovibrionales bacterium]|nr:HDOD domain-containing protein [Vampirovibrionales bacterium]